MVSHNRRFSNKIKQFALIIYFLGLNVFHFFQIQFCLLNIKTFKGIILKYDLKSGFNDVMFDLLSLKIKTLSSEALNCVLCADEMPLKTHLYYNLSKDQIVGLIASMFHKIHNPAKHALIFIIRGMNYDWKQPISYYLITNNCTGSILNNIIISTVRKLNSINTHVKAFITDQGQVL